MYKWICKKSEIKQVPHLTSEEFRRVYFPLERPVIITQQLNQYRRLRKWDFDFLEKKIGSHEVVASVSRSNIYPENLHSLASNREQLLLRTLRISEVIDLIKKPSQEYLYLQQVSIPDYFPELIEDIQEFDLIGENKGFISNLWMGPRGTVSLLHYDLAPNFLIQLKGDKRLTLFPPSETRRLYPFPITSMLSHLSRVSINCADKEEFPRFRPNSALTVTLHEGEILYMPPHWWHQVEALDNSISINFWWMPSRLYAWKIGFFRWPGLRIALGEMIQSIAKKFKTEIQKR